MKALIITIALLLAVGGCEEKNPVMGETGFGRWIKLKQEIAELQNDLLISRAHIANLEETLEAARDVNGINLNLLKRISSLETSKGLFGHNYMDNSARLDSLESRRVTEPKIVYDPNAPIYKFIPEAGDDWKQAFGDTDDTRMKHTISEIRVAMTNTRQRLYALEQKLADPNDPNEVKK